jgi:alanine dehydrogenase
LQRFLKNPTDYINFERFTKVSDIVITGHFHGNGAPDIITREMLQSKDCKIKVVGDISCDINGPVACTLRSSTIAEPFYGYLPSDDKRSRCVPPAAIVVMGR